MSSTMAAGRREQAAPGGIDSGGVRAGLQSTTIERVALLFCLVVGLVPIWSVERLPTTDGPMHLYVVHVLDQLLQPGADNFDRVFELNPYLEPNTTIYAVLYGLSRVAPLLTAEKIFVSGYWLLFASSAYYLMRAWGRESGVFAFLLLPLALGYFLHWGFYNFVLSQALFLLAAGYALRHLEALTPGRLLVLGLLMLLLAVTHLVGIAMLLFFLGLARIGVAIREGLTAGSSRPWRPAIMKLVRDGLLISLAALPALAIMVSFLLRRVIGDDGGALELGLVQRIFYVASVSPIFSLDQREAFAWGPFTLLLWSLVLLLLWRFWKERTLAVAALPALLPTAALGLFVLLGSLGFAGFEGLPRLLPFFFFMLVIALGAMRIGAIWRGAIMVAVCGGLLATSLLRLAFYRQANELYRDFAQSRPAPPPGSAVLAFDTIRPQRAVVGRPTGWRMNVTDHFRTAYARERGLVMLNAVHLSPHIYGYFPVAYRPDVNVAAAFSARGFAPPPAPLDHFERTTGIEIAEVSFWPLLASEPDVDFNLEEREPLLRRELAREWRLLPRDSEVAPFVFVEGEK